MRAVVIVIACAFACGKGTEPKPGDKPTTSPPAPATFDALKVNLDGKPVAIAHAYAKKIGIGERYQVLLTSKDSSCGELVDNLFNKREGAQTLLFDTGERIAPDGTLSGVVAQFYDPHGITIDPGSKASVKGSVFSIDLDVKNGSASFASVHGTFKAEDCGVHLREDNSGVLKAKHASSATIDFAGKKLPVVSAVACKDNVLLSSGPKNCGGEWPSAQVMIWRSRGYWSAHGEWLDKEVGNHEHPDPKTKDLQIACGANGTSADGPTVQLTLSGNGTIDNYPVAIAGRVEALDCEGDNPLP
jgi:hypothetical protein